MEISRRSFLGYLSALGFISFSEVSLMANDTNVIYDREDIPFHPDLDEAFDPDGWL